MPQCIDGRAPTDHRDAVSLGSDGVGTVKRLAEDGSGHRALDTEAQTGGIPDTLLEAERKKDAGDHQEAAVE
jgi:hypothetical protein